MPRLFERMPVYAANVVKAHEVILWLANASPGIDVYRLVKAAYFADKHHVTERGRPIIGDTYRAAPFGPLPQMVYALLRRQPIELLALQDNGDPQFSVDEHHCVHAYRQANTRKLSKSDIVSLAHGLAHVRGRSFNSLYDETHADPAYIAADGGIIDYRDLIPEDDPRREQKRKFVAENAEDAAL